MENCDTHQYMAAPGIAPLFARPDGHPFPGLKGNTEALAIIGMLLPRNIGLTYVRRLFAADLGVCR